MRALTPIALLATAALALPSLAHAQACEEGRVATPEGLCCWPGQTFDGELRHCVGAPSCPAELVAHGESCVARVAEGAGARVTDASSATPTIGAGAVAPSPGTVLVGSGVQATVPEGYGTTTAGWPAVHEGTALRRAVFGRGEDEGLITFALTMFDIGWVLGWVVGFIEVAGNTCNTFSPFGFGSMNCQSWPLAFIPVAGGIASGMANFSGGSRSSWLGGFAIGIPSVILQTVGVIAAIIAFANETTELTFPEIHVGDAQLSFVPSAPSSDAGLSIRLDF